MEKLTFEDGLETGIHIALDICEKARKLECDDVQLHIQGQIEEKTNAIISEIRYARLQKVLAEYPQITEILNEKLPDINKIEVVE
jgi:hypothetical protein